MEFHVSRKARDLYRFEDSLFTFNGNVIFLNFHAVRVFLEKMNEKRDLTRFPEKAMTAGQMNAMGLMDEIFHYIMALYRNEKNSKVIKQALDYLDETVGKPAVDTTLRKFAYDFPTTALYRDDMGLDVYLEGETAGIPHRQAILEEMVMLWLANMNPALSPFIELFDDFELERETSYSHILADLRTFFNSQPFFGPDHQNLVEMFRSPAEAIPHSLPGQLEYIRERWGFLLGRHLSRLLRSLDLIKEEQVAEERRVSFLGRGPDQAYEFTGTEAEPERFSPDLEWMPKLVLMAKNIYVWLGQLSKKYQRPIHRLDQIPDQDLELLARWGFSGLWLIGLWERSLASKKIKERLGNPETMASAYSLFDYQIANDLGGEEAYQNLKDRAWKQGIRLASDIVPNHVGIDSRWVIEHPDWFISIEECPFPAYRFNGPDLSWHGEVGIYLEDHYFDRSDAAVVFKRVDRRSGHERYVYHGNDGTHMPWNDTAQLNYLQEEVREAIIQTILGVAKKFPIIRFDAAMTLTKKHFQRLWFPEPGTGGAIPTRAEHGMTRDQFDRLMPDEFWRQVVDRVSHEAPDTLLLAEAFWLLEGYFVRTLGMHRVYNSAFMNMLKNEENAKYRSVMKNVLEFNPEILKRFVNFMNNPDEETALFQFGKGDKYFGICTMMVTLPGLPMFGHGQIEGFSEKYGMEYRYAKWDEQPDWDLIRRHEREIFPLMQRRHLFSGVEHFLLYDFYTPEGYINENVFAYSNRTGNERALILYHNQYDSTRGWIRISSAYSIKSSEGEGRTLRQKDLGESLGLHATEDYFCIFRDHGSGLEYIRSSKELCEKGLYVELGAYTYQVFVDFREVQDHEGHRYANVTAYLNGRGVSRLEDAMEEMLLQPLQDVFKELVNADLFGHLMEARVTQQQLQLQHERMEEIEKKMITLLGVIKQVSGGRDDEVILAREVRGKLEGILRLPISISRFLRLQRKGIKAAVEYLDKGLSDSIFTWATLFSWLFVHTLGKVTCPKEFAGQSRAWIDEWRLGRTISEVLQEIGSDETKTWRALTLVKLLTQHQRWFELESPDPKPAFRVFETLLKDNDVQEFLQVNRHNDILWFNKEAFDEVLWWLFLVAVVEISSDSLLSEGEIVKRMEACYSTILFLQKAEKKSGFQLERLLGSLKEQ